jgi:hypothetical protein
MVLGRRMDMLTCTVLARQWLLPWRLLLAV